MHDHFTPTFREANTFSIKNKLSQYPLIYVETLIIKNNPDTITVLNSNMRRSLANSVSQKDSAIIDCDAQIP